MNSRRFTASDSRASHRRIAHLGTVDCCIHPPGRYETIAVTPPIIFSKGGRSGRPPRCHSRSTRTCFAMPVGSSSPTMATTREPCNTTSGTRTFSTPSGTPTWRPTDSRIFGGTEPERPLHDAFVGVAGAGKLGTTSASPSITCAVSPARAANIASIAAMARSICSVLIALTPPACSTFISRGTSKAQIFMYAAGCVLRTFSIAAAPCFLKSAANASRKSLLNDLRVASKEPPGFPPPRGLSLTPGREAFHPMDAAGPDHLICPGRAGPLICLGRAGDVCVVGALERVGDTLYGARVYVKLGRRLAQAHAARQGCSDSLSQLVRDRRPAKSFTFTLGPL